MPQVSIFLHKSIQEYAEKLATVVDTSRSEIISDCIRYIKENIDESKVWEGYDKLLEEFEDKVKEYEETTEFEPEDSEEEESEEEEEEED